jgi:hypothetical protein
MARPKSGLRRQRIGRSSSVSESVCTMICPKTLKFWYNFFVIFSLFIRILLAYSVQMSNVLNRYSLYGSDCFLLYWYCLKTFRMLHQ